jgi:hypothetical protein
MLSLAKRPSRRHWRVPVLGLEPELLLGCYFPTHPSVLHPGSAWHQPELS